METAATQKILVRPSPQLNNKTNPRDLSILVSNREDHPTLQQNPATTSEHHRHGYIADFSDEENRERPLRRSARHLTNTGSEVHYQGSRLTRA